ncbi:MAG: type II toxin-antitoxin system HicA family toxin [Rhodospirillaceae bacterium]|nr:type II toxin-antitoxin system HicA family toxin [Rhodospirillaceae bacterium]
MARFPRDAPRRKVVRALGELGFEVVRAICNQSGVSRVEFLEAYERA